MIVKSIREGLKYVVHMFVIYGGTNRPSSGQIVQILSRLYKE